MRVRRTQADSVVCGSRTRAGRAGGVDGMDGILTMEGFDTSLAEGVMLLTPFSADAQDERTQQFVSAYKAAYGETPTQFAADSYDCVYILYNAIVAKGLTAESTPEECCAALQ